ncbi:MAG: hypothetical protein V9G19_25280 [Tetrasphaera sp.]
MSDRVRTNQILAGVDKSRVIADLIAHLDRADGATDSAIAADARASAAVETESYSVDDISQRDSAGDIHALLEEHDDAQRALIVAARALDVSATDVVGPGAVIVLDGERYVVGVASDEFRSEAIPYAGISLDAPLYAELAGRRAGERVSFRGHTSTIDAVC